MPPFFAVFFFSNEANRTILEMKDTWLGGNKRKKAIRNLTANVMMHYLSLRYIELAMTYKHKIIFFKVPLLITNIYNVVS